MLQLLLNPTHQLLHLHVQRRCQGDEGAQARVHWGAGAGLALLELLVGVGGDAGGVGQGFLAEALGDAGALQPQTELSGDGPPLLVLAGGGGSAHDHQRRAVTDLAPPYMYGNLGMSAETEGGELHGWRLTTRPTQGPTHPTAASYMAAGRCPSGCASLAGVVFRGWYCPDGVLRTIGRAWWSSIGVESNLAPVVLLVWQRPDEDHASPWEEPAVVAVAQRRRIRYLGEAATFADGGKVEDAHLADLLWVVAQLDVETTRGAVDVQVHHMTTAERAGAEAKGDDDRLLLLDDLLAKINGVDLGDLIYLPGERHRRAVDGELLQGEDLWIGDGQPRYWPAVPHTRLPTLGYQLVVALAVGDDGELAEAVPRCDGVLPADT